MPLSKTKSKNPDDWGERTVWSSFSLSQVMRRVEDKDDLYSLDDLTKASISERQRPPAPVSRM